MLQCPSIDHWILISRDEQHPTMHHFFGNTFLRHSTWWSQLQKLVANLSKAFEKMGSSGFYFFTELWNVCKHFFQVSFLILFLVLPSIISFLLIGTLCAWLSMEMAHHFHRKCLCRIICVRFCSCISGWCLASSECLLSPFLLHRSILVVVIHYPIPFSWIYCLEAQEKDNTWIMFSTHKQLKLFTDTFHSL